MKKVLFIILCVGWGACTQTKQSTIEPNLQTKVDSILPNKMSEIYAVSGQTIVIDIKMREVEAMIGNCKKQTSALMRAESIQKALGTNDKK